MDVYLAAPGLQSTLPGTTATTSAAQTVPTTGTSLLSAVPTPTIPSPDIISVPTQVGVSSSCSSGGLQTTEAPSIGGGGGGGGDAATTVTATKLPDAVTVTTIKFGEVAQSRCTRGVQQPGLVASISDWPTVEIFALGLAFAIAWVMVLRDS